MQLPVSCQKHIKIDEGERGEEDVWERTVPYAVCEEAFERCSSGWRVVCRGCAVSGGREHVD